MQVTEIMSKLLLLVQSGARDYNRENEICLRTLMSKALLTLSTITCQERRQNISIFNILLMMHTFKKQDCISIVDINSALCPKPKLGELSHEI
jgi:hypothetical protein